MATTTDRPTVLMQVVFVRMLMFIVAGGAVYTGFALLTSPWAIPLTIGLWVAALGIIDIAIGELPQDI
jgi:hypothetical protein